MEQTSTENKHILGELIRLAAPAAMERLLLLFSGLISMMIAGKIGGQTLVAVSMCNTLFDIIQAVFIGLSVGSTILITRNVGCGHMELPRRITAHSIGLNLFLGIGIMLTLVLLGKNIITVLFRNLTDAVIEQSVQYLRITVWCIPFIGIDVALSAAMRGIGDMKTPFYMTLIANAVQVMIGVLTVFVFQLGLTGSALAFMISRICGALLRVWAVFFTEKYPLLRIKQDVKPSMALLRQIMHYGTLTMAEQLMLQLGFLGMQLITSHIDTETVGAYQIANSAINLIFAVTFGFESAQITMIGRQIGANDRELAWKTAKLSFAAVEGLSALMAAAMILFSNAFLSLFSQDPLVLQNARMILRILALFIPITSVFQGTSGILKTGGKASTVLLLNLIGPWCIRIPLAYLLCVSLHMGITGLMIGLFADYFIRAVFYFLSFRSRKWLDFGTKANT